MLWKLVKLIGFTILIIISLVVLWFVFREIFPARRYLLIGDQANPTRVEIPYDIVKREDCKAYQDWIHNNFTPILVQSDRCPWRKKPTSDIAHFVWPHLGLEFNVPRAYLWQDSWEPDGVVDGIYVMFRYPDMEAPTQEDYDRHNTIRITLEPNVPWQCEKDYRYCNNYQLLWWDHHARSLEGELYPHKVVKHLEHENLNEIETDVGNHIYQHRFIRGNFENPELWYECTPYAFNPGCEGGWNYDDKIYVDFYFGMKFLHDHDQIRQKIFDKIRSWQLPATKEK